MSTSSVTSSTSEGSNVLTTFSQSESSSTFTKCPRCFVPYDFLKRSGYLTSKVPLILHCQHTLCEDCIYRLNFESNAYCPVCGAGFPVPRNQLDHLCEIFIPHYSLIGYLMWTKNNAGKKRVGPLPSQFILKNQQELDGRPKMENDETDDDSTRSDFVTSQLSFKFDFCAEHSAMTKNIYCEECEACFCCYCFIDNHGGHKAIHLYKLTEVQLAELPQLKTNVRRLLTQLQATKKELTSLKSFSVENVEMDIRMFFSNMHGRLYVVEDQLRKKLSTLQGRSTDLSEIVDNVKKNIWKVAELLPLLNNLDTKEVKLREVFEELKAMMDVPCVLISNDEELEPVVFVGGDKLEMSCDNLDVKETSSREYRLVPCENWESVNPNDTSLGSDVGHSSFFSTPVPTTRLPEAAQVKAEKPPPSLKRPVDEQGNKIQRVIVTHINDLDSFYVQDFSAQHAFKDLTNKLSRYRYKDVLPDEIVVGRSYAVLYETKKSKTWRRGKVVDVVNTDPQNLLFNILYVDYGNSQVVSRDKMKKLDLCFTRKAKSFASECKLFNPPGTTWPANAHLHFAQIVAEKEVNLKLVKKLPGDVKEVELLVPNSQGGFSKITEMLLRWSSPTTSVVAEETNGQVPVFDAVKLFLNTKSFKIQQIEDVVVSHVADPDHIYVQLAQHLELFDRMKRHIEEFYTRKYSTCIPVEGSDAVVRYDDPIQGSWHRARILSVYPKSKTAEVLFVDWGKCAEVAWSNFKQLSEEFTRNECQAIAVKLAHVDRFDKTECWPEEVSEFLTQELCCEPRCKMVVSALNPLEVVLFKYTPSAELCVNALLVEKKLGVPTGSLAETVYWIHEDKQEKLSDSNLSSQLIKKTEEVIIETDAEIKGMKTQVQVIRCENPHLIYVKFATNFEKEEMMYRELKIFYNAKPESKQQWKVNEYCVVPDQATKYARGLVKEKMKNDHYLVHLYDQDREVSVPRKSMYVYDKYFQKSYVNFVYKCHLVNIKPAGDSKKWSNMAIEVIQQIFETYKSIYIQRVYNNLDGSSTSEGGQKSLAVNMWYALTIPGNALEPAKLNYILINQTLVESGLALSSISAVPTPAPVKSQSSDRGAPIQEVDGDLVHNGEANKIAESGAEKSDSSKDWYELMLADEAVAKSEMQSWLPMTPIKAREFDAVVTCIDNDGIFSIRDLEMDSLYKDLEQYLNSHFSAISLSTDHLEWYKGQMCTVHSEGGWYRGTIMSVRPPNEVIVEQIDFGSDHSFDKKYVNKFIMYPDIPPLISKVRFYDVTPRKGLWDPVEFDTLLKVVTNKVKVVVKESLDVAVPCAEIYREDGRSLNDLIVELCPGLIRGKNSQSEEQKVEKEPEANTSGEPSSVSNASVESDVVKTFRYARLPPPFEKTEMSIVSVIKFDTVVVNGAKDHSQISELPTSLNEEIQKRAESQPVLTEIKLEQPCICKSSRDGLWCRAEVFDIENVENGFVYAFLVDYGLVDMVMVDELKVADPMWMHHPVFNYVAYLNVKLAKESQVDYVMTHMNRLCGKSKLVEIIAKDPLTIQLYENATQLYYHNFVKCGILNVQT